MTSKLSKITVDRFKDKISTIKYSTLWVVFSIAFCRLFTSFIEVNLLKFQIAQGFTGIPFINTPLFIKINK